MISLKGLFKRNTLNDQGTRLSRIITENLVNSDEECLVDFDGVSSASVLFFQDFLFPLVLDFGSETVTNRLKLVNLKDEHLASYQEACSKTSDYMERISARQKRPFGDISDLTCELMIKARELSRHDPSEAQVIFGISGGMIASFANMDLDQIRRVANAGIICFEPRFTPKFAAKLAALETSEIDVFLNVVGQIEMEGIYDSEYS
jgi:STAS-like domain of unknown function (DUF4325)